MKQNKQKTGVKKSKKVLSETNSSKASKKKGTYKVSKIVTDKTNNKKKAMIAALEKSLGIVTTACKNVDIDRSMHYDWMAKDSDYKKAVEDISEITLDFAESQLHKQIQGGEVSSTIFFLKTKGKKRGYIEKTETSLTINKAGQDLEEEIYTKD